MFNELSVLFVLIFALDGVSAEEKYCFATKNPDNCPIKGLIAPGDRIELEEFCRDLKEYYSCIEFYKGDKSRSMCPYYELLRRAEVVIPALCRKGDAINTKYIQSAGCLKKASMKFHEEAPKSDELMEKVASLYSKVENSIVGPAQSVRAILKFYNRLILLNDLVKDMCDTPAQMVYSSLMHYVDYPAVFTKKQYQQAIPVFRLVLLAVLENKYSMTELGIEDY